MTLFELVPSLELCQQLKAAGFPQDTAMVWIKTKWGLHVVENGDPVNRSFILCAAPTAEEILKGLPWTLQPWPPTIESAFLHVVKDPDGFRVAWYTWDNKQEAPCDGKDKHYEKESEAAAQAFLWWKKEVAG